MNSYLFIIELLYRDYYDTDEETVQNILESISTEENQVRGPFNIITEEYDGKVLTSIKTEIAILESLSKIITIIFDTNQYLVPTPQFNVYTEDEDIMIDNRKFSKKTTQQLKDDSKDDNDIEELPFVNDVDSNLIVEDDHLLSEEEIDTSLTEKSEEKVEVDGSDLIVNPQTGSYIIDGPHSFHLDEMNEDKKESDDI